MEACKVYTRYDYYVVGEFAGEPETRRERNNRVNFSHKNPELIIPDEGLVLWNIYFDIATSVHRVDSNTGYYNLISPTEFQAYNSLMGLKLTPFEYEVLRDMDKAYCQELNKDVKAKQERYKSDNESKRKK